MQSTLLHDITTTRNDAVLREDFLKRDSIVEKFN